jgi:hypothetical protein
MHVKPVSGSRGGAQAPATSLRCHIGVRKQPVGLPLDQLSNGSAKLLAAAVGFCTSGGA